MRCLTVLQPWAHAIMYLGKSIENRSWRTSYRGPLLIHAGRSRRRLPDPADAEDWYPEPETLVFGCVLGVVDLIDCVPFEEVQGRRWAQGPQCWLLRNPRPLKQPLPWRGRQLLFDVPDDLLR